MLCLSVPRPFENFKFGECLASPIILTSKNTVETYELYH